MVEQTTLAKRKFVFDLGVGGSEQDVIDKLEAAKTYKDLIVKAVRYYPGEEDSSHDTGTEDTEDLA